MQTFDAIIIGAGQAGPSLAGRFNDAGKTVAIIERKHVGGTCVNTGCKPTKTLVASAYAAHLARRSADYGIGIGGEYPSGSVASAESTEAKGVNPKRTQSLFILATSESSSGRPTDRYGARIHMLTILSPLSLCRHGH